MFVKSKKRFIFCFLGFCEQRIRRRRKGAVNSNTGRKCTSIKPFRQHLAFAVECFLALIVTRRAKTMRNTSFVLHIGLVEPPIERGTSEEVREIKQVARRALHRNNEFNLNKSMRLVTLWWQFFRIRMSNMAILMTSLFLSRQSKPTGTDYV